MSNNTDDTIAFKNYRASDSSWKYLNPPMECGIEYPVLEKLNCHQISKKLSNNYVIQIKEPGTEIRDFGYYCGGGLCRTDMLLSTDCNAIESTGWYAI
jgi:hypothetical protein